MLKIRAHSEQERANNQTITSQLYYTNTEDAGDTSSVNLGIFAGVVLFALCFDIIRVAYFFWAVVKCNRVLHDSMFHSVLRAPMYFFNTHPIGKIITLDLSSDIYCE